MKYTQTFAEAYRQVRLKKELSEDHEASMAIGQLKTIQDNLNQLMSILQSKSPDYELEAWVQSKITSANDKMTSAADYMKNSPSVSEAVEEEESDDKNKVADLKTKLSKEKDSDALERQIVVLTNQIGLLKSQLENEKNKLTKPEPNPLTGEVPLRTGVAAALLDKKGPQPDVEMGVYSGGNKMNQGNLY